MNQETQGLKLNQETLFTMKKLTIFAVNTLRHNKLSKNLFYKSDIWNGKPNTENDVFQAKTEFHFSHKMGWNSEVVK